MGIDQCGRLVALEVGSLAFRLACPVSLPRRFLWVMELERYCSILKGSLDEIRI